MTILMIFVCAFNRNKNAKLYLHSTFQTSDIELLRKMEMEVGRNTNYCTAFDNYTK